MIKGMSFKIDAPSADGLNNTKAVSVSDTSVDMRQRVNTTEPQ